MQDMWKHLTACTHNEKLEHPTAWWFHFGKTLEPSQNCGWTKNQLWV